MLCYIMIYIVLAHDANSVEPDAIVPKGQSDWYLPFFVSPSSVLLDPVDQKVTQLDLFKIYINMIWNSLCI